MYEDSRNQIYHHSGFDPVRNLSAGYNYNEEKFQIALAFHHSPSVAKNLAREFSGCAQHEFLEMLQQITRDNISEL